MISSFNSGAHSVEGMAQAGGAGRHPQNMYRALKHLFGVTARSAQNFLAGVSHFEWQEDPPFSAPAPVFLRSTSWTALSSGAPVWWGAQMLVSSIGGRCNIRSSLKDIRSFPGLHGRRPYPLECTATGRHSTNTNRFPLFRGTLSSGGGPRLRSVSLSQRSRASDFGQHHADLVLELQRHAHRRDSWRELPRPSIDKWRPAIGKRLARSHLPVTWRLGLVL